MRNVRIVAFFLFSAWFPFHAGWSQGMDRSDLIAAFDSANASYERQEFGVALQRYEALLSTHRHFETEFNAGNAAFKLGELGKARLHYERAALLDPSNAHLEANLALLKSKIVDRITPIPKLGLGSLFSSWVGPSHVLSWAMWTLFWWTAAWLLWAIRWRKTTRDARATLGFLGTASMVLGVLGMWGARECHRQSQTPSQLVVLADRVDVLSTPSSGGTVLFQLHEGARACILDRTAGWAEIELDNGNVGWIPDEATEDV